MTAKQALEQVLQELPEGRLHEVLDFARFLNWQEEQRSWQEAGRSQLARYYGEDEPEYSEADIQQESD